MLLLLFCLAVAAGAENTLGDTVFYSLDKNRDNVVTIPEMNSQLLRLEQSAAKASAAGDAADDATDDAADDAADGDAADGDAASPIALARLRQAAPYLFNLLDDDEDRRLDRHELRTLTRFEGSLADGAAGDFARAVFEILDDDVDDRLSVAEVLAGTQSDFVLGEIATSLHELLPLRDYPHELKKHIKRAMNKFLGDNLDEKGVAEAMEWLGVYRDGYVHWLDVAKAYNSFGKKFLHLAAIIKSAGSMTGMLPIEDKENNSEDSFFKVQSNIHMEF